MELIVKAVSASHPDPEQDRMSYKKGDVVEVRDDGAVYGRKEGPPLFVIVKCPGVAKAQAIHYMKSWEKRLDYKVLSANKTTGVYQLRVFADEVSASGLNAITREMVEAYLTKWGATVNSIAANSVIFTVRLWPMLQSDGFWDVDVDGIAFALASYDPTSGDAVVTIDYFSTGYSPDDVMGRVTQRGGEVLSLTQFRINRQSVIEHFKQDIKSRIDGIFMRRRYCFDPADVDLALSTGGVITLTAGQILDRIHDRLVD